MNESGPVMTVPEVALYLKIPKSSIYKLAQEGRIPCQKVGRHWRFHKAAIEQWIMGNDRSINSEVAKAADALRP